MKKKNNKGDKKIIWINRKGKHRTGNKKKSRKWYKDWQDRKQKRTQEIIAKEQIRADF